ncbi:hypothetical protein [Sphingomicrobium aestuariivivum]|uniref:hypothetical protein n=1 Tax=Sphingomicrobium aestuariivivum TaxID=1582356 RepID=UPI001FD68907|nr:hypothetical protein [Sphingomicrobium aestuariivivum]MCJ8191872.1 hypothetical protein [Sphingomicrobium aestuariivivum]
MFEILRLRSVADLAIAAFFGLCIGYCVPIVLTAVLGPLSTAPVGVAGVIAGIGASVGAYFLLRFLEPKEPTRYEAGLLGAVRVTRRDGEAPAAAFEQAAAAATAAEAAPQPAAAAPQPAPVRVAVADVPPAPAPAPVMAPRPASAPAAAATLEEVPASPLMQKSPQRRRQINVAVAADECDAADQRRSA